MKSIEIQYLILQLRWIEFKLDIAHVKQSVKQELVLSLFVILKTFPDTPIAWVSSRLLSKFRGKDKRLQVEKFKVDAALIVTKYNRIMREKK